MLGAVSVPSPAAEPAAIAIPAQSMATALSELSRQTGLQVLADGGVLAGKRSAPVIGAHSPAEALQRLLAGTGLGYRMVAGNLAAITVLPNTEIVTLDPVAVVGERIGDGEAYSLPTATTATKTATPLLETPAAIQPVSQQLLKDQQITRIGKALENVSGVIAQPSGDDGDFDMFRLRGFYNGDLIYRDGVPIKVGSFYSGQRDTANLERIEVLKGSGASLYGRMEPGGMVNLVTKQPMKESGHWFTQQFGSYGLYRTSLDSTGPLTGDGAVSYRMNFAYENSGSFRQFGFTDRKFLAPVLRFELTPRTRFTLEAECREAANLVDFGLPLVGGVNVPGFPGRIPDVPITRNFGEPTDRQQLQETLAGFHWSHDFDDRWSLNHRFTAVVSDTVFRRSQPYVLSTDRLIEPDYFASLGLTPDDRRILFFRQRYRSSAELYYTTLNVTGSWRVWGAEHNLVAGADANWTRYRHGLIAWDSPALSDLYQPRHGLALGRPTLLNHWNRREGWWGVYLQDQVKLPLAIQLLAGLRYDRAYGSEHFTSGNLEGPGRSSAVRATTTSGAFAPRIGLLWQPRPQWSLYGNISESSGSSWLDKLDRDGRLLPPETTRQWELGSKIEGFDGRLSASLAWFELTKRRMASSDPACSVRANPCYAPLGAVRSRGLELDISGEPLPGWRLIGSYTYLTGAVVQSAAGAFASLSGGGGWLLNPRHAASLWTTYQWNSGPMQGFSIGAGTLVRGKSQSAVGEPGYALLNLMLAYAFDWGRSRIIAQLNADNLLNKGYYLGSDYTLLNEFPGAPRSFLGSLRVEW